MDPLAVSLATHVPAAARGDRDAFAVLVDATRSVVSSIALAIVRDSDLSRDIAQDVFLAAWRDLGQLRDPNSFLPWLRQLTRHRAYHVLRTERRRDRRIGDADIDALIGLAIDPRPDAGAQLLAEEERRLLAAVLDELPDEAREVVTLYYREGQSTAHVAALLGLSDANVRQRLARARARLRQDLLDRYGAVAAKNAPDGQFTAAIMIALSVGAPSVSSAATATMMSTGASWVVKVLAAGSGALLGAAGGMAGVLYGSRRLRRGARSIEELDAIKRFEFASIFLIGLGAVLLPISWAFINRPWQQMAVTIGVLLAIGVMHLVWLPRLLRDRHVLEALEDPVRAERARRMERRVALVGITLGLIAGLLAAMLGFWLQR
jgi:RNA polymerase sigma factor (sigma-70 family)